MSDSSNNIFTSAEKRKLSIRSKITIEEDSDSEEKHSTSLKENNYTDSNKFYNQNRSLEQNDLSENKDLNLNELLNSQEQSLYQSQFSMKQIYQMKMMKLKVHALKTQADFRNFSSMITTTQALKMNHSECNNLIKNACSLFSAIKLEDISNYEN